MREKELDRARLVAMSVEGLEKRYQVRSSRLCMKGGHQVEGQGG